jgi:hypothetical protein
MLNKDFEVSGHVRVHLEDQERDGRVTLRWVLGKNILRMGGGCNWLIIGPLAGFGISSVETSGSAIRDETTV